MFDGRSLACNPCDALRLIASTRFVTGHLMGCFHLASIFGHPVGGVFIHTAGRCPPHRFLRVDRPRLRTTVTKLIDSNKLPHLLFYGPPGTGKTSTILACAKKLYGDEFKMMVLEVRPCSTLTARNHLRWDLPCERVGSYSR